jgi:hypothetical protein
MSDDEPFTQPPTTRIGGGGPAHAIAVGIVTLLVVLVWIGWSGRPGPPGANVSLSPVAEAPGPVAGTAPSPSAPPSATVAPPETDRKHPTPTPGEGPSRPMMQLAEDVYGFTASVDGGQYFGVLRETGGGRFYAANRLPFLRPGKAATVELHQLWTRANRRNYAQLGSWPLPLGAIGPEVRQSGTIFEVEVTAQPQAFQQSLLVRRGFKLEVGVEMRESFALLEVKVAPLPRTRRPGSVDQRPFPAVRFYPANR